MTKLSYAPKLFRQFVGFALENKAYWMIPLALVLGAAALVVVFNDAAAPEIYTLF